MNDPCEGFDDFGESEDGDKNRAPHETQGHCYKWATTDLQLIDDWNVNCVTEKGSACEENAHVG